MQLGFGQTRWWILTSPENCAGQRFIKWQPDAFWNDVLRLNLYSFLLSVKSFIFLYHIFVAVFGQTWAFCLDGISDQCNFDVPLLLLLMGKVFTSRLFGFMHFPLSRSSKRKGHRSTTWAFERNRIIALFFEALHFMWNSTRATPGRSLVEK